MTAATHNDVVRIYPGIQDHAVIEILAMQASVAELEAAMASLSSDQEDLIEFRHRDGDRLNQIMRILSQSGVEAQQDRDR